MSSCIEFRQFSVALPGVHDERSPLLSLYGFPPLHDWNGDGRLHVVFVEAGDSNCFDMGRRVARRWHLGYLGSAFQVLRDVTHVAGDSVHSGGVCLHTRARWTRPENYIAHYRKVLQAAVPYEAIRLAGWTGPSLAYGFAAAHLERARTHPHTEAARPRCETSQGDWATFQAQPLATPEGVADLHWLAAMLRQRGETRLVPTLRRDDSLVESLFERSQAFHRTAKTATGH